MASGIWDYWIDGLRDLFCGRCGRGIVVELIPNPDRARSGATSSGYFAPNGALSVVGVRFYKYVSPDGLEMCVSYSVPLSGCSFVVKISDSGWLNKILTERISPP
jgi:hypothetical protein